MRPTCTFQICTNTDRPGNGTSTTTGAPASSFTSVIGML